MPAGCARTTERRQLRAGAAILVGMIDPVLKRSLGQMMKGVEVVGAHHDGVTRAALCAGHHAQHDEHGHHHGHAHSTPHSPDGDLNLHAARLHVIADAATSVLAIVALLGGLHFGWSWLDPAMGLVGAVLVTRWAIGLLREGSRILLDREMDHPLAHELRGVVAHLPEAASTHVSDLHVWRVGRHQFACVLRLVTTSPTLTALAVREHLAHYPALVHATVEIDYSPTP